MKADKNDKSEELEKGKMAFCYALVSRGNTPLCQHCAIPGNFDLYYQKFLPKADAKDEITMLKADGYIWGIMKSDDELTVLCVMWDDCDKQILIKVLKEIKVKFLKLFGNEWKQASSFSLQSSFERHLIEICGLIEKTPLSLGDIIPPNYNDSVESSDVDDIPLLGGVSDSPVANRTQKSKCLSITLKVFLVIFALVVLVLIILKRHDWLEVI